MGLGPLVGQEGGCGAAAEPAAHEAALIGAPAQGRARGACQRGGADAGAAEGPRRGGPPEPTGRQRKRLIPARPCWTAKRRKVRMNGNSTGAIGNNAGLTIVAVVLILTLIRRI